MSNDDSKHNPLADQLTDLDVDVSDRDPDETSAGDDRPVSEETAGTAEADEQLSDEELFRRSLDELDDDEFPSRGTDPGPPPESSSTDRTDARRDADSTRDDVGDEPQVKSDRQLFEEAVDDLDPAEMYDGKFRGQSGTSSKLPDEQPREPGVGGAAGGSTGSPSGSDSDDRQPRTVDEQQSRRRVQELRDEALFQKMVGDVDPLEERDKYHEARRRGHNRDAGGSTDDEALLTPSLPRSGDGLHYVPPLGDAQTAMLDRFEHFAESNHVPVLNVRGKTRRRTLELLRDFMDRHHADDRVRFVRLVPGRGLQSDDDPVLKPALLEWLEGPGRKLIRGYVPERVKSGDYGSLVVELDG